MSLALVFHLALVNGQETQEFACRRAPRAARPDIPKRKEAYTTYLYVGFALIVAVLTVVGFLWW